MSNMRHANKIMLPSFIILKNPIVLYPKQGSWKVREQQQHFFFFPSKNTCFAVKLNKWGQVLKEDLKNYYWRNGICISNSSKARLSRLKFGDIFFIIAFWKKNQTAILLVLLLHYHSKHFFPENNKIPFSNSPSDRLLKCSETSPSLPHLKLVKKILSETIIEYNL